MFTQVLQEMSLLQKELNSLDGVERLKSSSESSIDVFSHVVTDPCLRKKTEKLFPFLVRLGL